MKYLHLLGGSWNASHSRVPKHIWSLAPFRSPYLALRMVRKR